MKKLLSTLVLTAALTPTAVMGADYGLPSGIQEGNILHCFNWTAQQIKAELPNIAAAGYGSVQMSPLQRPDIKIGYSWHDLYRPYDLAFQSSEFCSEQDLKDLCSEAAKYGIKVIVDVVANHVDKTAGYHDTWWDANGRVRWNGGINYGDRYSITHGQLGDYGDVNSEDSEVIARGKAYVEKLKAMGVKGIRWDAAKHIAVPSEGCNFWSEVTSVAGMYNYGEILNDDGTPIAEYAKYMSVTDNRYSNSAAQNNGGIPGGPNGDWVSNRGLADTKVVYWGESHDTYSNDEWSQNVDQSVIDRAYAAMACRNGATALYFARPDVKGFNNIKVGKGNGTAYKSKQISEVNKFRNAMVGKKDYFETNGNACSITRQNGGAVIVMKGSGNVSIANGGGYCPAGTYTDRVSGGTFTVTASTITGNVGASGIAVIYNEGDTPIDPIDPIDPVDTLTIYYDNSTTNWTTPHIHYWTTPSTTWPGVEMTKVKDNVWSYTFSESPSNLDGFLFCNESGSDQTADKTGAPAMGHLYKGVGGKGAVTDAGVYQSGDIVVKPVVTANPASGTSFEESLSVTLTVAPAATIYYTLDGSAPSEASAKYSSAINLTATTTIKTLAVTADGGKNTQSFSYTKKPQGGGDIVVSGDALNTDYYKVNPNGQAGTFKTINMNFDGAKATNALSNWSASDMIAQGVARDVAQAIKGVHERPIIDSYAIYAAYDNDYLYLGAQFVYLVWDLGGEGKQPGESKPYNMDGRLMWAFDLNPDASFDGYIDGTKAIWNDENKPGAKFENGVDAVWVGSSKPGVGTPGFFVPTPDGHASYDAAYCKSISGSYYGYADGLLPSIDHIWGQESFGYDPAALATNNGFVDLKNEIDESAHTFYEWKLPLSVLGVTADYIQEKGIGVMFLDIYGSSPIGGTPYDPSYFDNAKDSYSADPSSSAEKEDEDVIKFAPARIGKALSTSVDCISDARADFSVYGAAGKLGVNGAAGKRMVVAGLDGAVYFNGIVGADSFTLDVDGGLYIVNVAGKAAKVVVK